ncbi:MAG: hypothetical protein FWD62_09200 [Betaproteobacteria bacterium]|nr:hypothetical protein [Betaproteobacteria bacterium]
MRKEYDFSQAKRAADVPHLAKLQATSASVACYGFEGNAIYANSVSATLKPAPVLGCGDVADKTGVSGGSEEVEDTPSN